MSNKAIAAKLLAVSKALGWVKKRGTNEFSNYQYAMAVDIFADVREPLNEQGVVFSWSVDGSEVAYPTENAAVRDVRTWGTYAFTDTETGEVITGNWQGFASDKGDKALWKAITGALKYVFISTFLLPTGDDPENDKGEKAERKSEPKPVTTGPTPPKAEQVKTEKAGLTPKQRGLFESEMHRRGLESAGQRKSFITFATGRLSSKQMTSDDLDKALKELKDDASVAVSNALAVK